MGPMLGALVRWIEVSKYKVSKRCQISLLPPSDNITSIDAVPIMIITNTCAGIRVP